MIDETAQASTAAGPTSPLRLLARGTSWQALGQVVPLIINLVLTPYIMKGLGLQLYGIFLFVSVVQVFLGAVDGGIGPSANRYFTIYAGRGDQVATTRLLTTLLALISVSTVVFFGFCWFAAPWIISFFPVTRPDPAGSVLLLRVMIVLVAMAQIRSLFAYVLFAQHKFGVTTSMLLLGHLIYAAGLVWTVQSGLGLAGIAWTLAVQQIVATFFIIPSTFRYLTRSGIGFVSGAVMRDFWGYSWKVQLSSLLDILAIQGDMLIVSKFAARQQPLFGPGSNFAQQLRMVPMNAFSPIQALVGRAVGGKGDVDAREDYHKVQRLWVVGVVGWVCAAAPATLFGVNAWLARSAHSTLPGQVAAVLLVGHLCYLLSTIQIIWCLAIGRSDLELRYGLISLVLNLGMTIALIIPFGVIGSVIATAISQLISSLALTWMMKRQHAGVRSPWSIVPYDAALLCLALSYLGAWGMDLLTGDLSGALALVLIGLGALPALVVYLLVTVGLGQIRQILSARRG